MKDLKQLELLKEKKQLDYKTQKDPLYNEIHILENQQATELAEIDNEINVVKAAQKTKADIRKKIELGLFTNTEYSVLSDADKQLAKDALFDIATDPINPFYGLNALEYTLIGLAKVVFKCLDTTNLTTNELAFYNKLKETVNLHPMAIDNPDCWELKVVGNVIVVTIENRTVYIQKKIEITGSF